MYEGERQFLIELPQVLVTVRITLQETCLTNPKYSKLSKKNKEEKLPLFFSKMEKGKKKAHLSERGGQYSREVKSCTLN